MNWEAMGAAGELRRAVAPTIRHQLDLRLEDRLPPSLLLPVSRRPDIIGVEGGTP